MPTPGSPANSTTEPGTRPPPSTRLSSWEGSWIRGWSPVRSWDNSRMGSASPADQPGRDRPAGGVSVSTNGRGDRQDGAGQKAQPPGAFVAALPAKEHRSSSLFRADQFYSLMLGRLIITAEDPAMAGSSVSEGHGCSSLELRCGQRGHCRSDYDLTVFQVHHGNVSLVEPTSEELVGEDVLHFVLNEPP